VAEDERDVGEVHGKERIYVMKYVLITLAALVVVVVLLVRWLVGSLPQNPFL
jgi:hypothetical protein